MPGTTHAFTRRSLRLAVAALLAVAAVLAGVVHAEPSAAAAGGSTTGSITGVVVDSAEVPVPQAVVAVWKVGGASWDPDAEVNTDATGRYAFTGLVPGEYRLSVEHPGYTTVYWGYDTFEPELSTSVLVVTAGGVISDVDATLYRPVDVTASVRCRICSRPVQVWDIQVTIERLSVHGAVETWASRGMGGLTAEEYVTWDLRPGTYRMVVSSGEMVIDSEPTAPQVLEEGGSLHFELWFDQRPSDDFTGVGLPDILARTRGGVMLHYPTDGRAGWLGVNQIGSGWQMYDSFRPGGQGFGLVVGAGDFDGYGGFDLLARSQFGHLVMYRTDGRGGWLGAETIGWGWQMFDTIFSPRDFDEDGRSDVVGRTPSGLLYMYSLNFDGSWIGPRVIGSGWGMFDTVLSPRDFDGDGHSDIMGRTPSGLLYLYPGDGTGGWLTPRVVGWGWNMFDKIFSEGDFDSDGYNDVLARTPSGLLYLYPGNGSGGWLTPRVIGSGWQGLSIVG